MESPHMRSAREFLARPPFSKRSIADDHMSMFCAALTHDSHSNEHGGESYERLEFLGDAVIELIACEHIYRSTDGTEGNMTEMKQNIVCNKNISSKVSEKCADLGNIMRVSSGHKNRITKANIIEENMRADSFEALVGAFYLAYGLEECRRIVSIVLL